ncbi:MAG TPA: hypothetical protein VGC96_02745 [Candidatus Elarobacter sp.]
MNHVSKRARLRVAAFLLAAFALAACGGGGGGGGGSVPPGGGVTPQSVTGDMIAYQASRGWNYHGNAFGLPSVTMTVYADPPSGSTLALVLLGANGTLTNATGGAELAGLGLQNSASGYNATAYLLLDGSGGIYAGGGIPGFPLLVPSTLTQGQSFSTYPGVTGTTQFVGTVPGASACPTPATGATVQYTYLGQTYLVSYVPGCGITDYVGNHGEHLTLASVGSYPQLGTLSKRRLDTLTVLDSARSLARIIASGARWSPSAILH